MRGRPSFVCFSLCVFWGFSKKKGGHRGHDAAAAARWSQWAGTSSWSLGVFAPGIKPQEMVLAGLFCAGSIPGCFGGI